MDIQKIILNNTKDRYLLELKYTEDDDIKNEINNIITKLEKPLQNKIENFNNKINELEQLSMKKQFYRLKTPQKINLLKNYFISQNIDLDKIDILANDLIQMIEKDIIKNKDVEYDIENVKIIKLNKVEIVNNELKFIKSKTTKNSSSKKSIESVDKTVDETVINEEKPKKKIKKSS
jgi:hypothetical protein